MTGRAAMNKRCTKCEQIMPISQFGVSRRANDGLQTRCKLCAKEYRINNRDAIREYHIEYHKNNIETVRARRTNYRSSMKGRALKLYNAAKLRAVGADILFDMSIHRIEVALMIGKCERTGVAFDMRPHDKYRVNPFAPSIDKIDPFGGYTDLNVKVVCDAYNRGKNQMTHDEFLAFCRQFVEFNK